MKLARVRETLMIEFKEEDQVMLEKLRKVDPKIVNCEEDYDLRVPERQKPEAKALLQDLERAYCYFMRQGKGDGPDDVYAYVLPALASTLVKKGWRKLG